jgi:SAM-dependent methyltransferase
VEEDNKCIICSSQNTESFDAQFFPFLWERMFNRKYVETELIHCLDCDFYFSSYRPTDGEMERLYNGYRNSDYQKQRQKYEPDYTEEYNNKLSNFSYGRYNRLENFLDKYINPQNVINVLDYGGDRGQYIPKKYLNRYVYDISNVTPELGVKNIMHEKLPSIHWDLIMCCQFFEHLSYPITILDYLIDILAPDSFLYIEVPYENICESFMGGGGYIPFIHEHINYFRPRTFYQLFNNRKDISVIGIHQFGPTLRVLIKRGKVTVIETEKYVENGVDYSSPRFSKLEKRLMTVLEEKGSLETQLSAIVNSRTWRYRMKLLSNDRFKSAKNICIFGLGKLFHDEYFPLGWYKAIRANLFCDSKVEKLDYADLDIIKPDQLVKYEDLLVITWVTEPKSLERKLEELGIYNYINIFDVYKFFNDKIYNLTFGTDK